MSESTSNAMAENNYLPIMVGVLNFGTLLMISIPLMNPSAELWDFIFVAVGIYFTAKFIQYVSRAHAEPLTRVSPNDRDAIPMEGIYKSIRHPVAAGAIYMNIAYIFFFRSLLLIPIVPILASFWYIYAKYDEKVMLDKFGDEYREYMKGTSMFRGAGYDQQRLASSGYDMY